MKNKKHKTKYVFVVGGVMSGVGKGITTSSIGTLLSSYGLKVALMKADPYLNVDAGTMNPIEHGEVFVLNSGLETDQDMGNYERFLNKSLPAENYMTNGMVFQYVINKERALGYGGKCVEPTFHITEEIMRRINAASEASKADVMVIEIGGTVGEYQNAIFLEVIRHLKNKCPQCIQTVMVSYLPIPSKIGEMKTKPTQNAVRQLNSYGIQPDFIVARAEHAVDDKRKEKIADMCGVAADHIISAPDVESIYDVPLNFKKDGFGETLIESLGIRTKQSDLSEWAGFVSKMKKAKQEIKIAIVGKYFSSGGYVLSDVYISIIEALKVSAAAQGVRLSIDWYDSRSFEANPKKSLQVLQQYGGILVPGGFGSGGIEGKINVIEFARTKKIPYFGICYGMQLAVIEFARNAVKLKGAHTQEVDKGAPHPIVMVLPDQELLISGGKMGGTMRLGAYSCSVKKGTHAYDAYKKTTITERHRHRYEVNPAYHDILQKSGMVFSGMSPDGRLVEIAELPKNKHPFFVGVQFHPEFLARPLDPHPLFSAFIKAAKKGKK